MKTIIIIPARFASQRFPGKPLQKLTGATGIAKSLLQRSFEAAKNVPDIAGIYVATDDERIAEEAQNIGAETVMTSSNARNGTERVAEAYDTLKSDADLIINLQGDAPLTPPHFVSAIIATMDENRGVDIATPMLRCDAESYASFKADRKAGRVGATTMVTSNDGNALYFSKEIIPYSDAITGDEPDLPIFHHVGLYGYTPAALAKYVDWYQGPLETIEGLEQLRFLENDHPIRAVSVEANGAKFWELNNPSDVTLIEDHLAKMGIE